MEPATTPSWRQRSSAVCRKRSARSAHDDDVFGHALPEHQAILLAIGRRVSDAGLHGTGGARRQWDAARQRHPSRFRLRGAEKDRKQFLNARARKAGDTDDGPRVNFQIVDDKTVRSFQIDNAQRANLDRRHAVVWMNLLAYALRAFDH